MHYIKDTYKKRIDLYFDEFPSDEIRAFLKNEGWKWNSTRRCWFSYLSQQNIETAVALGAKPVEIKKNVVFQGPNFENKKQMEVLRPLLNRLYACPRSHSKIRLAPVTADELDKSGLPSAAISEYTELLHDLYESAHFWESGDIFNVEETFLKLVRFCKANKMINDSFQMGIDGCDIACCAEETFENFCLQIERLLTETDPSVQLLKCMYNVDVIGFEWWRDFEPTLCELGHFSKGNREFNPLSRNELYLLLRKIKGDISAKIYSEALLEVFDYKYWEQIILWQIEATGIIAEDYDNTLYIHKGRIVCQTQNHAVVQATAFLTNAVGSEIALNVNHCSRCKKFFMSYSTYRHYRDRYGTILGDLKMLKTEDYESEEEGLAEESPLHLCGYSVSEKAGLSMEKRQNIISFVIDHGIMEKDKVISHLNWLIDTNSPRQHMQRAINKWNDDLAFTLQYNLEHQEQCIITALKRYHPNQFRMKV